MGIDRGKFSKFRGPLGCNSVANLLESSEVESQLKKVGKSVRDHASEL